MILNEIQERINRLLSFFVTEVKGATAMGRADINHVSEVVLVPLLSKVFDYPNLTNLNYTEQANYPGIDLGDAVARVSFQVTSTSNSKKVKETLDKFVTHKLYEKYDRLIIYNLAEKQGSYSGEGFEGIIKGKFKFDKDRDIIDYSDVLKVVSSFQVNDALEILRLLEVNFSAGDFLLFDTPERVARRKELIEKHLQLLRARVSKVRILGDPELYDLTKVFVELTVLKDRERPSSRTRAEYWEVMDAELRERRDPFAGGWSGGDPQSGAASRTVRPEDLLKAGTRAVVAGAPGAGKSTLMKYLALSTMSDKDCLPLFLELNTVNEADFDAAKGDLAELVFSKSLAEKVCEMDSDRPQLRAEFYKKLRAGLAAIFLDGLDEVSGTGFFDELRLSVKEFLQHGSYRDSPLFISSRPYALLDYFDPEAQEFEILPLGSEQMEKFVGHYYGDDPPAAAAFLEELRRRSDLRELASVPALLGFLLILYRTSEGGVPEDRLELYRLVVQKLAGEWDKEKPAKRAFQTSNARRIAFLSHLAFSRLFEVADPKPSRRFIFTGQEIFAEAERYCASKGVPILADALAEEVKATALLREVGADAYAFAHLTLQEYMAATTLLEQSDSARRFCRAYFDQTLSEMEVLPMFLGLAEHRPDLHNALKTLPESIDHKQLRLRARSLAYGQAPQWLLAELGDRLDELVSANKEIEYGYFDLVVRSFRAAAGPAGEAIIKRIASRLTHDEPEYVRSYAVRAAGILGNEAAVVALRLALEDPDASVRVEAASRLALKDEQVALEVLTSELGSDADVKDEVIYALWNLGSECAVDILEEAAEIHPVVRKRSLEALASIREEAAVPTLARYLNDSDDWVRRTVVESLREIGGPSVIPHLIKAADDRDVDIAEEAVESLGRIGGAEVIQFLTDLLENRSGKILGAAAEALGQAGAIESIPRLVQLLDEYIDDESDDDFPAVLLRGWIKGYVRAKVAGALCQLGDERGRAALVEAITKGYSEKRKEAAKALARCRPDEARTLLPEVIGNIETTYDLAKYDIVALADILYHLNACDDSRVITAMIYVLKNSHGWHDSTTSVATNVLGRVGGQVAVEALTKAAEQHDPMRQMSAMLALGNIASENTVTGLLKGLTAGINVVSQDAARGLSRVETPALYEGLKGNTQSDYPVVRQKVARCIFYYSHDEDAVKLISEIAASDSSEKIKETARQALSQLERKRELFD